jgi:hypothetical protein
MTVITRSFQARTLSLRGEIPMADHRAGAACGRGPDHAARRHVRACRHMLMKARTATRFTAPGDNALRGRVMRPEMRVAVRFKKSVKKQDSKSPRPFSRRGLLKFCDDEDLPVICPTCQTLMAAANVVARCLFKSLHRRRGFSGGHRFGCFDRWRRRTYGGGSLVLRDRCRLMLHYGRRLSRTSSPWTRPPHSPGMRDRRSCSIPNERTCHCAHRS